MCELNVNCSYSEFVQNGIDIVLPIACEFEAQIVSDHPS